MFLFHSKFCCKNDCKIFDTMWSTGTKSSYEVQQARTAPILYICHPQFYFYICHLGFILGRGKHFCWLFDNPFVHDMLRSPLQLGYTFNNNLSSPLTSASLQDLLIPSKPVLCGKSLVNITKFYSYNVQ